MDARRIESLLTYGTTTPAVRSISYGIPIRSPRRISHFRLGVRLELFRLRNCSLVNMSCELTRSRVPRDLMNKLDNEAFYF